MKTLTPEKYYRNVILRHHDTNSLSLDEAEASIRQGNIVRRCIRLYRDKIFAGDLLDKLKEDARKT